MNKSYSLLSTARSFSWNGFDSLLSVKFGRDFKNAVFNLISFIDVFRSNAFKWLPRELTDDKSTLVQVASHYLNQCWPSFAWPHCVKIDIWQLQYIPRNMHTVFVLLCFVVVIHWLIFPYPSGLLHWHCGNLTIAPVSAKQPWWIWINTSYEFIMNDCISTTKQSTTKPSAYFLGYTVCRIEYHVLYVRI